MPASSAGVPSIGLTTVRIPSLIVISMPIPLNESAGFFLQVLQFFRLEVGTVGIEGEEQALDGAVDRLLGIDFLDVIFLQDAQDIGEYFQLLVGLFPLFLRNVGRRRLRRRQGAGSKGQRLSIPNG